MENLLYYPYINVPKSDWTNRALLYYDSIGCVVPSRYNQKPKFYEKHMRDLIKENLVLPIDPMDELNNPWRIVEPFIEYVNSPQFDLTRRRNRFQKASYGRIHRDKFDISGPKIHIDKFDNEVFYQLEQIGLAESNGDEWYNVEKATANELMTYISTILAKKLECRPMTDRIRNYYRATNVSKKDYKELKVQQTKRQIILNNLIPFPEQIDYTKLRRFKETHSELLVAFRNTVEVLALDPNLELESAFFNEKMKELRIRKNELSAKMNENKFGQIFFGSICGAASAIIAFSTGFGILGAPAFANAIYSALQYENPEDVFDQTGLKYMALIDKKLRRPVANTVYSS